jgi:hypothetical protein
LIPDFQCFRRVAEKFQGIGGGGVRNELANP